MVARDELTHRLFVAIELDEERRDALVRCRERLAGVLTSAPGGRERPVRWVARELLHVTVRFLGTTPDAIVDRLRAALAPRFSSSTFQLCFDRLGVFPEHGRPRVVWAGPSAEPVGAAAVTRELDARLSAAGVAADARAFRPHVTLGRFRVPGPVACARAVGGVAIEAIPPMAVDCLTLFESRLSSRGPTYVPLQHSALGPPIGAQP